MNNKKIKIKKKKHLSWTQIFQDPGVPIRGKRLPFRTSTV
jgi:hypothetical protein